MYKTSLLTIMLWLLLEVLNLSVCLDLTLEADYSAELTFNIHISCFYLVDLCLFY